MISQWHIESIVTAKSFLQCMKKSVIEKVNTTPHTVIEDNRKKLRPIIKSILYCETHDISVSGKTVNEGNFVDLLKFRIDSG